ncbi:MAG: hypothetical protein GYA55_14510 [SAR324 cluster bacterium]|uniref:tRNA (Adenosine(37)-N6)-dimethylallyltransferase MiaA n=1 Tax=SAR324 cluster bacterium TaxID=2024889 RepID=A0A7X9FU67_9DELT|nr:hypothetical protein [SAR324 cluster bacterium]
MKPVIIVSGPTASGKSDLAILIAQSLNGEIINIDSVQVYKHFNIGSAKIPKEQQKGIRHHLVDLKEPADSVDAGWYIKEAKACI